MKSLFGVLLLLAAFTQAQTIAPPASGLQVASLRVTEKKVRSDDWHLSMLSTKPPQIKPDLGRGTTNATDTAEVAHLEDMRQDLERRKETLRTDANMRDQYPSRWIPVFVFQAEMRNTTAKPITKFVWAYHIADSPDQQYLCNVRIEPGQSKLVKVISPVPHPRVVAVTALGTLPAKISPSANDMLIDQIQFADNSEWRNPSWNAIILSRQGARKLGKGKCIAL